MEVRRTVPVTLDVDSDDAVLLEDTVDEFRFAAQYVADHAFHSEYVTTSKAQLQDETYDDVREQTPLNAGLVQNARNKAADACKSVVARWKNGKKSVKTPIHQPTRRLRPPHRHVLRRPRQSRHDRRSHQSRLRVTRRGQ
jgi:putative transposase